MSAISRRNATNKVIKDLKVRPQPLQPIATDMFLPNYSGIKGMDGGIKNVCWPDGSAAAPSWHFCQDTDTGFYRIGVNRIGVATNGVGVIGFGSAGMEFLDGYGIFMTGDTSGTLDIYVPAVVTSYEITLPGSQGAANSVLTNNGSGTLSWGKEAWPIGSVFIAVVSTNPNTLLGYGTWSAFGAGKVLVGIDAGDTDFDSVEETGGSKTKAHTHDIDSTRNATITAHTYQAGSPNEIVAAGATGNYANHTLGGSTESYAATTVQPYIVVYMWKRTA